MTVSDEELQRSGLVRVDGLVVETPEGRTLIKRPDQRSPAECSAWAITEVQPCLLVVIDERGAAWVGSKFAKGSGMLREKLVAVGYRGDNFYGRIRPLPEGEPLEVLAWQAMHLSVNFLLQRMSDPTCMVRG